MPLKFLLNVVKKIKKGAEEMVRKILVGMMFLALLGATYGTAISLRKSPVVADTQPVENDVGQYSALAVDGHGAPHISYYDASAQNLKYAFQDNNVWNIVTVDAQLGTGWDTSLALDAAGNPHVSYYNSYNSDLMYAVYDGRRWQVDTVDAADNVGRYSSIALDWMGAPHISYYDAGNGDLKYAWSDGVSWWVETVDAAGNVGLFTALQLDANGQPSISYYDQTNQAVKLAAFDGTSWQIQTADTGDRAGRTNALALDSHGQPYIAYFDLNGALKVAHYAVDAWQVATVDAQTQHVAEASLAVDAADHLWLTYYAQGNLNLASFDGEIWRTGAIDVEGDVGRYSSLALSPAGLLEVSYYDASNGALRFAVFDESGWWQETVDTEGLEIGAMPVVALPEPLAPVVQDPSLQLEDTAEVAPADYVAKPLEAVDAVELAPADYVAEPAVIMNAAVPPAAPDQAPLLSPVETLADPTVVSVVGDDASGYTAIPVSPDNVRATGKRIAIPALGPTDGSYVTETWESWIYVQNVGSVATKAVIFYWNSQVDVAGGICPGPIPDTMTASGTIPPGGMLKWRVPKEAKSGIIYSVKPREPGDGSLEYPDPNDDLREWNPPCPYTNDWEGHIDGEDLAVVVKRFGTDGTNGVVEAIYRGLSERELGLPEPSSGSYMYYAPLVYNGAEGFVSTIYIQNAGCECVNSIELHLQQNTAGCAPAIVLNVGMLSPGQAMRLDLAELDGVPADFKGTAWIRATEQVAVIIDNHQSAKHMLQSYQAVPAIIDPFVNHAAFLYREWSSEYPDVQVQNLNATINALVKVYFLDRSGDIIHTMVEWICPRGSRTFTLPPRLLDLEEGGSVRIESHSWDTPSDPKMGDPKPVGPAHILSIVNLNNEDNSQAVSYNATPYDYIQWTTVLAIPYLSRSLDDTAGTEIVLHNMNPNPGWVKVKLEFFDEAGGPMFAIEQTLMGGQVDYIRLGDYGFITPGFIGSALVRVIEGTQSIWAIEATVVDRDYSFATVGK